MKKFMLSLIAAFSMATTALAAEVKDPENTLALQLKDGTVLIEMYPDVAPNHVARIKELVRQGFYDGIKFHRVIDEFMAQTGDPTGTGRGGSGKNLKAEFNHKRSIVERRRFVHNHERGYQRTDGGDQSNDRSGPCNFVCAV